MSRLSRATLASRSAESSAPATVESAAEIGFRGSARSGENAAAQGNMTPATSRPNPFVTMTHATLRESHASSLIRHTGQRPDELDWRPAGELKAIYSRVNKEPAPRRVLRAETMANYGIVGDRHACPHSPRQLLIAGDPAYQQFDLPEAALRENVRVSFSTLDLRSGDLLRIGPDVVLWLTFHCEPCSLLERWCPGTIKSIGHHRGMLARVLRGGTFTTHDEVFLARSSIPAMSNDWQVRVRGVANAVPDGHYIIYRQLAEMAGVANAYCRAFPKVLSKMPAEVAGRVLGGASSLPGPQWSGTELYDVSEHFA